MTQEAPPPEPTCTPQWAVICDHLDDLGHPRDRVDWLRRTEDPVTVGMVARAEPRVRDVVAQWWQVGPPRLAASGPSDRMVRLLLLDAGTSRETVWQQLPEGFGPPPGETRLRRHVALGTVIVAYRGAHDGPHWPRWNVLYQQRWALAGPDHELAHHTHRFGARFADGGLEALLRDLEAAQRQPRQTIRDQLLANGSSPLDYAVRACRQLSGRTVWLVVDNQSEANGAAWTFGQGSEMLGDGSHVVSVPTTDKSYSTLRILNMRGPIDQFRDDRFDVCVVDCEPPREVESWIRHFGRMRGAQTLWTRGPAGAFSDDVDRTAQVTMLDEPPGEQAYVTEGDPPQVGVWSTPPRGARPQDRAALELLAAQPNPMTWDQACEFLSLLLGGGRVQWARDERRMATVLSWEGATVELSDVARVLPARAPDAERELAALANRLMAARRAMPNPPAMR